ncbi:MAG: hypothetical protein R3C05_10895 [Pirellulaceae bacterium]
MSIAGMIRYVMCIVLMPQHLSKEGFRLLWFHSQSKAETDAQTLAV